MKEKCGVFGIYSRGQVNVTPMIVRGLEAIQHRGQESWGVAVENHPSFRKMGLVAQGCGELLRKANIRGRSGIGHVRYSTLGSSMLENAHPIPIGDSFRIAHNGTIVNTDFLKEKVGREYSLSKGVADTKIIGLRLLQILKNGNEWFDAFEKLSNELVGAYSFTFINSEGEVYGARDPAGFRPLCIGWHKASSSHVIASESCALTAIGADLIRDVKPGEIVKLSDNNVESHQFAVGKRKAHCAFEYVYFAHPSSKIDGVNVYDARKKIGKILGRKHPINADVIIPVPDSARPAALGYSQETGITLEEGIIKDRYRRKGGMRSFIEPTERRREGIVRQMIPIPSTVKGKDVVVVDDSIVRGTSSKILSKLLRKAGAKKIKMVLTFPPISFPCYMGIDFPTQEELIAYRALGDPNDIQKTGEKVAKELHIDELVYNDTSGLSEGIGIPLENLCTACVQGEYALDHKLKFKNRSDEAIK